MKRKCSTQAGLNARWLKTFLATSFPVSPNPCHYGCFVGSIDAGERSMAREEDEAVQDQDLPLHQKCETGILRRCCGQFGKSPHCEADESYFAVRVRGARPRIHASEEKEGEPVSKFLEEVEEASVLRCRIQFRQYTCTQTCTPAD